MVGISWTFRGTEYRETIEVTGVRRGSTCSRSRGKEGIVVRVTVSWSSRGWEFEGQNGARQWQ